MATNLQLDDELIEKAVQLGVHKTKREAVTKALEEYVGHLERLEIVNHFGTFDFDPTYDYKKERSKR